MAVNEDDRAFEHPLYDMIARMPGLDVMTTTVDKIMTWGSSNSLWIFPMATSCCGIEFMAGAASRVDMDRMGTIVRGTPRQSDVMVVAGTITVKMAPRVKRLWDQMPEPKWCVAMGSCAISGDFYRDIYSVIPGIDVAIPVDVYIPGCPPNPETLMGGMLRLQEKIKLKREGKEVPKDERPETKAKMIQPRIGRFEERGHDNPISRAQLISAQTLRVFQPWEDEAGPAEAGAEAAAEAEAQAKSEGDES